MSAVIQIPAYIKADLVKAVGKKLKVCLGAIPVKSLSSLS